MSPSPRRLVGLIAALALLAGCGSDAGDSSEEEAVAGGSASDGAASPFPVSIENKFGTTEIESEPERVVTIGYNDQDFVLSVGVVPVAVRYWYGEQDDPFRDWADDALSEAGAEESDVEVLTMPELNFEQLRVLRPDVVIAMYAGITESDYDTLTEFVPVVAPTDEYNDYGTPWQETLRTVGSALGRSAQAAQITDDIQGTIDDAAAANPQWAGMTLGVVTGYPQAELGMSVFSTEDPRSRLFTSMGFELLPEIDEIAGDGFYAQLSSEQVSLIDTDVVVWDQLAFIEGGRATIEADPLVAQTSVVQDGRVVWLDGEVEDAFGWQSPLSLPVALQDIVSQLETVAPGA